MQIDKVKLISEITEAFKSVELENGIGLSEADAIDSYSDIQFKKECRENDEKHDWSLISSDVLNKYNCSLSFFDAKGLQFHLPAFMIAEIDGKYNFGMSFPFTNLSTYTKSRFEILSSRQRHAIKLFLEYILEEPNYKYEESEIKNALEHYWSE